MKLASRNVNGIRSGINKGTFFEYLEKYSPEIIGLQELKAKPEQIEKDVLDKIKSMGYEIYWNPAIKAGYSGTAVLTKIKPILVTNGMDISGLNLKEVEVDEVIKDDSEGRVITVEYDKFYLINVYTPNSKHDLSRLEYRQTWDYVFLEYIKFLETKKPVIVCGDLNAAHKEIDLANPAANKTTKTRPGNAGFTDQERAGIQRIIDNNFIDTFRYFYPDKTGAYSRWSNFGKARERNIGWRIDYFFVSKNLKDNLKDAFINPEVMGSDHCPVGVEIVKLD